MLWNNVKYTCMYEGSIVKEAMESRFMCNQYAESVSLRRGIQLCYRFIALAVAVAMSTVWHDMNKQRLICCLNRRRSPAIY